MTKNTENGTSSSISLGRGYRFIVILHLFKHIEDQIPQTRERGYGEHLIGGVEVSDVGTDRDHVHIRKLALEESALETCVDANDLAVTTKYGLAGVKIARLHIGALSVIPSGVSANVLYLCTREVACSLNEIFHIVKLGGHGRT